MRNYLIAAAALIALPMTSAMAEEKKPPRDPDEVVCKSQERTNTRFKKKTCRTRAEWQQIADAAKRDAKELLDGPVINTDPGN